MITDTPNHIYIQTSGTYSAFAAMAPRTLDIDTLDIVGKTHPLLHFFALSPVASVDELYEFCIRNL